MRFFLSTVLFIAATGILSAQNDTSSNSLPEQYNELKSKSNNYQIYKVVKESSLDEFWGGVRDTLQAERARITSLNAEVKGLNKEVSDLKVEVATRDNQLAEQEHMIEHMSFLGIPLTKTTYITFTWILIFGLFIAALVLYFRFNSAHRITSQTRKEIQSIQEEFDTHRQRTRENETKLKRDLQTEINKVEELQNRGEGKKA
ncbi:MAG: hypothetical protein ABR572_12445 [Cryomorphaceae bacterium]